MPPIHIRLFSALLLWCCWHTIACQPAVSPPAKPPGFSTLKQNLEREQTRAAYDSLHFFLVDHYTDLSGGERRALREALEQHAVWPFDRTCPASEPGNKMVLHGRLTDDKGAPLPGVLLHTFHTNARGYYAPTDSVTGRMGESDPRLEGFLTTDSLGRFDMYTVRPASYPKQYEGRTIPQHVHMVVAAPGFRAENFQVVFDDDPAFTDYWAEWAQNLRNPVVHLQKSAGMLSGDVHLKLIKK